MCLSFMMQMSSQEFRRLLKRYKRGVCTPDEEALIHQWYDQIKITQREEITDQEHILWQRIQRQSYQYTSEKTHTRRSLAWAAVLPVLMVAGLGWMMSRQSVEYAVSAPASSALATAIVVRNDQAEARRLELPDGSTVVLQHQSEVSYGQDFASNRTLSLKGEAFFDVKRDAAHPFVVKAGEVLTRVLGTSFTVRAYQNAKQVTVSVKTGKVSVYTPQPGHQPDEREQPVVLVPNQQVVYNRENKQRETALVEKPQLVLEKPTLFETDYDGASVARILEGLEQNYGVEIVYDAQQLANCTLTTSMKEEGFFERISIICEAIDARYELKGTVVYIYASGC